MKIADRVVLLCLAIGLILGIALAEPVHLIELHNPKGRKIFVNPAEITALRESGAGDFKHFSDSVHCWLGFTGGKYATVVEDCATVRRLIEATSKPKEN